MNIVFYLSRPLDLRPVYEKPIPPELFEFNATSLFSRLCGSLYEIFPDAEYYTIDGSDRPVFYQAVPGMDVLNIPTEKLFPKLFLFSSFSAAFNLSPLTVFIPANTVISSMDDFTGRLRSAMKNGLCQGGITFFTDTGARERPELYPSFISPGETVFKDDALELVSFKQFHNQYEVLRKIREKAPGVFHGHPGLFMVNTLKWMQSMESSGSGRQDLFYMLVNCWKDGQSINTVIRDVIGELENESLPSSLSVMEEKYACGAGTSFEEITGLTHLMKKLKLDENGNYVEGAFTLKNVKDSFLVNRVKNGVELENLNSVYYLAKDNQVRSGRI